MKVRTVKKLSGPWSIPILYGLFLVGVLIAATLTWHHENHLYGDASAQLKYCSETALVSCDAVNSSQYSELVGIPIALFAIPFYVVLLGLVFYRHRNRTALTWVLVAGLTALVVSLILAGISYFKIGFFCLWCVALYLINASIPLLIALTPPNGGEAQFRWHFLVSQDGRKILKGAALVFFILLALSVFIQKTLRTHLRTPARNNQGLKRGDFFDVNEYLYQAEFSGPRQKALLKATPLKNQLKPNQWFGLLYVLPGFLESDLFSLKAGALFRRLAPEGRLILVAPIQGQQPIEEYWENVFQFKELQGTSLLFDPDFKLGRKLQMTYPPSLVLVDPSGKIAGQRINTTKVLEQLLSGGSTPEVDQDSNQGMPPDRSQELIGKCAPTFRLSELTSQQPVSLSFPKKTKKPTLLFFWNALCKHCQDEVPRLMEVAKKHPNAIDIVTVSRLRPGNQIGKTHREQTQEYIKQVKFSWPVLVDSGLVSFLFGVSATPTSVLIAPDGTIQDVWTGENPDLEKKFEQAALGGEITQGQTCGATDALPRGTFDFAVLDALGKPYPLTSFLEGPTLIHVWSPQGPSCREELSRFLKFSREARKKGVETVLVSLEKPENASDTQAILKSLGYSGRVFYYPHDGLYQQMDAAYTIPRTYLIDKEARVLTKYLGPQDWNERTFQELVFTWIQ